MPKPRRQPTVTAHTARKARRCGAYPCSRDIEPGERFMRHVALPGDDGYEDGTVPWVMEECCGCVADRGAAWPTKEPKP